MGDIVWEIIPEKRRGSLHSDEITVSEGETVGQVIAAQFPNLVSATPDKGKVFKIVLVITGSEEDAPIE